MRELTFRLPIPPSVNRLYYAKRGRPRTKEYRAWLAEADKWAMMQDLGRGTGKKRISGKYTATIVLPRIRGDADNRIKATLDWLASRGITDDDRHCIHAEAYLDEMENKRECWVTVREVQ